MRSADPAAGRTGLREDRPAETPRFAELSTAQRRLWFLSQMSPGLSHYNEPILALHIAGPLDLSALRGALDDLVRRQAALRTTFPAVDGHPVQRIAPPAPCPLPVETAEGGTRFALLRQIYDVLQAEAHHEFDLTDGPLFAPRLIRLGDSEHILSIAMHHIITDGWSLRILLQDLVHFYRHRLGHAPPPPDLTLQCADYAVWEREALALKGAQLADYWKDRLRGAPPERRFLADLPAPHTPSFRGRTLRRVIAPGPTARLQAVAERHGVSLYVVLLAMFKALIARLSGRFDVIVGTPVANRQLPEAERLIGFFVNVLVLRTSLSGNPVLSRILADINEMVLGALEHQMMPFDTLVGALGHGRGDVREPYIQLFFAHHNFPAPRLEVADLTITRWRVAQQESKFSLVLFTNERDDGGLDVAFTYDTDLYLRVTVRALMERYMTVLGRLPECADVPLSVLVPVAPED